jgi:hypothetical protein
MLLKTTPIRAFTREDIPEVANLWMRTFRQSDQPASPGLKAYFEEVFFDSPWYDSALPSFVYPSPEGRIVGFIGVMARPMMFGDRPIRVAVATQLMLDPQHRGFPALELVRRFFAGEQDLSFSDGARDLARRIWERCGGQTAQLYCFEWRRTLRPAAAFLLRASARRVLNPLARLSWPAARLADAFCVRCPSSPYRVRPGEGAVDEAISVEELLACVDASSSHQVLRPRYDRESLSWILRQAGQARSFGLLRTVIVREASGAPAGWCIYYLRPGSMAQVMQFGAERHRERFVLEQVLAHVQRNGALGMEGQIEPRYLADMAENRCRFSCPGLGVLVQSHNAELLAAIHRGEAFLSRLEGEWWLRLGIDRHWGW